MSSTSSNFDEPVKYAKGHVIFAEGEPSSYLYIVISGEVRIFKEDKNRVIPISVVREKDFIGELSMFSDEKRSASAVATKDTQLMLIKKSDIRKVLKMCPDWVTEIMNTLSERLRGTIDILREHRIEDDLSEAGKPLTVEESNQIAKAIKDYKTRRGLL